MAGRLHKRSYCIGEETCLNVYGDCEVSLDVLELIEETVAPAYERRNTIEIFLLLGKQQDPTAFDIPDGAVPLDSPDDVFLYSHMNYLYGDWYGKAQSVSDLSNKRAVISIPGLRHYNRDFVSRFIFRPVLDQLLYECGYVPLHGAVVAHKKSACIIVGHSGTGKSTLLWALVNAGQHFFSDDRILVSDKGGSEISVDHFPEHVRLPDNTDGPKDMIAPPLAPGRTAHPDVILFLENPDSDGNVVCERIKPSHAAARILHHIPILIDKDMSAKTLSIISGLCNGAKSYLLTGFGREGERLEAVLKVIDNQK